MKGCSGYKGRVALGPGTNTRRYFHDEDADEVRTFGNTIRMKVRKSGSN